MIIFPMSPSGYCYYVQQRSPCEIMVSKENVEGDTRFTIRYEAEVRGFFKLLLSLLARSVKRQHEGDLRKVKELMEARAL